MVRTIFKNWIHCIIAAVYKPLLSEDNKKARGIIPLRQVPRPLCHIYTNSITLTYIGVWLLCCDNVKCLFELYYISIVTILQPTYADVNPFQKSNLQKSIFVCKYGSHLQSSATLQTLCVLNLSKSLFSSSNVYKLKIRTHFMLFDQTCT